MAAEFAIVRRHLASGEHRADPGRVPMHICGHRQPRPDPRFDYSDLSYSTGDAYTNSSSQVHAVSVGLNRLKYALRYADDWEVFRGHISQQVTDAPLFLTCAVFRTFLSHIVSSANPDTLPKLCDDEWGISELQRLGHLSSNPPTYNQAGPHKIRSITSTYLTKRCR
ncbi:hypothetical protein K474DRAFT_1674290 [Panus rudis PR-1116 ss-1]|nr:hypothetical protein K474DRAFT_1674290 [Panus rudis PR-1116 ss-1]